MNESKKRELCEENSGFSPPFEWSASRESSPEFWLKKSSKFEPDLTIQGRVDRTTRFNELHAETLKYMSDAMADLKKKKPCDEKEVKDFAQRQVASLKVLLKETPEFDENFLAILNRLITSLESSVIQSKNFNTQVAESFFLKQREALKYPEKRFSKGFY